MVVGEKYYLRVDASYINKNGVTSKTGTCDIISFVYGGWGSVGDNVSGIDVRITGTTEPVLSISAGGLAKVEAKAYNSVGVMEGVLYDGEANGLLEIPLGDLAKGMHLIVTRINGNVKTLKVIK